MTVPHLDPFSQVYNGLWTLIERNKTLDQYIPAGNRITFEEESEVKYEISEADTPELQLIAGGGGFGSKDNSTQRSCTRQYIWMLSTGDLRINPKLNKIQWEIFRCMNDWECVLCPLTWCDCRFVLACRLTSADDGTLMQDLNRNIPGWCSMWNVEVDFAFPTTKLRLTV